MALLEQQSVLPFGAIWDEYCRRTNTPLESELIELVSSYEREVLGERS
jgi:L-rhamnose isomerase